MSVVQSEYPNRHVALVDGQIADTQTCDIDSLTLEGAVNVPFGRMVRPGAGAKACLPGIRRQHLATVNGAINNSATTLVVDALSESVAGGELVPINTYVVVGQEILLVTGATATDLTVVRGVLGSTAAAIADNAEVWLFRSAVFSGIAVQDERLPASSAGAYTPGEVLSVLHRGDVAVKVSAAVAVGQAVVAATRATATAEVLGQLSAKTPDSSHVLVPGARFVSAAAAQGIAIVRFTGATPNA